LRSEKQVVERSLKPAFFSRSLRQKVKVHEDLVERLPKMLRQRVLDHLGLARRAGQLTLGFEQVQARLRDGSAGLLVSASDASEDGKRKLFGLAKAAETGCEIADFFSRDELSRAVGREGIVHLAVENGKLAATMIRDLQRLNGLSGGTQKDRVISSGRATPRRNRMAD
jgi:ribosomal protein L7Ae-like RNA K-turn-binding protein